MRFCRTVFSSTVASSVDLVVHTAIDGDGARRVREIVAVTGRVENGIIESEPVFTSQNGRLVRGSGSLHAVGAVHGKHGLDEAAVVVDATYAVDPSLSPRFRDAFAALKPGGALGIEEQRVKTVLTRQLLDNLYWVNNPLMVAQTGTIDNPEMLKSPVFGGTVFVSNKATLPPAPLSVPFIGDKALMAMEYLDGVIEMRTGVSRSSTALDPETLQNQTATAANLAKSASHSQVELIARNQAELGWKRVFKMILRLVVKHQDRPRTIRLRDEWVDMDPRHWNSDMDLSISVGLGIGGKLKSLGAAAIRVEHEAPLVVHPELGDRRGAQTALRLGSARCRDHGHHSECPPLPIPRPELAHCI